MSCTLAYVQQQAWPAEQRSTATNGDVLQRIIVGKRRKGIRGSVSEQCVRWTASSAGVDDVSSRAGRDRDEERIVRRVDANLAAKAAADVRVQHNIGLRESG